MRIDGLNSYASLTSDKDGNQEAEPRSADASSAPDPLASGATGDSGTLGESGSAAASSQTGDDRQLPEEGPANAGSPLNQRARESNGDSRSAGSVGDPAVTGEPGISGSAAHGDAMSTDDAKQPDPMRSTTGAAHGRSASRGTLTPHATMSRVQWAAAPAPPRGTGGSESQAPGAGGATGANGATPPDGGGQLPRTTPPVYQGQNVFTRQVSGAQYVSVQGGSWLSLDPVVISGQVISRFGQFANSVLAIQDKLHADGSMTTDDVTALVRYGVVMHALMRFDPTLRKQVELQDSTLDGPEIRYLGSVKVRTDYTPAEVAEMTSQALRNPFSAFVKSAQDVANKLNRGEGLTPEEADTIERYAGIADQFQLLSPAGRAMRGAGVMLGGLYDSWQGKPLTREMSREMLDLLNTRVDMRTTQTVVPGNPNPPLQRRPGSSANFNPPTRQPDNRFGYVLGPTSPPKLPGGYGQGPQPGPSGVGAPASQFAGLGRAQASKLKGKGPLNLRASGGGTPPDQPLGKVAVPFNYYRNDRDVRMNAAQPASETPFSQRREVLTVGAAKEATSYDGKARTYFGNKWDKKGGGLNGDTEIIKIDNGREGVGAIAVPFENIPRGGSVVVTGGALSGCTFMMTANKQGFYAYHAGTDRPGTQWTTANNGASAIVGAHNAMGAGRQVVGTAGGQSSDLVSVAEQYPFSVIVYNGKAQVLPAGATGPAGNKMTSFNYYEPDPRKMAVGTAEAVISKDRNGNVVVRVWVEKGALTNPRSAKDGTQTHYKMENGQASVYGVPASP